MIVLVMIIVVIGGRGVVVLHAMTHWLVQHIDFAKLFNLETSLTII